MKRFTSAALVLGAMMALAPAGAFARGSDRDRDVNYGRRDFRERVVVRHDDRGRGFERSRDWRERGSDRYEYARNRYERGR